MSLRVRYHVSRFIYSILPLMLACISIKSDALVLDAVRDGFNQHLEKGVFLVASRAITDPRFKETVILVTEFNRHGAIGVIINRPTDIDLAEIFPDMESLKHNDIHPYIGGPIHPTFLSVLINTVQSKKDMSPVLDDVLFGLGTGFVKNLISEMKKIDKLHVYFGYAGWIAGQLELELRRGDWYIMKGDTQAIFNNDPTNIWSSYIELVDGIWI